MTYGTHMAKGMTEGKKKPAKGKKPRKSMNVVNGKYATNG